MDKQRKRPKDKETGLPQRYVPKSLTPSQRRKQIKSIKEGTPRPKLKGVRTRRSPNTIKAQKYFGEGNTGKRAMAKRLAKGNKSREERLMKAFDEIYDRGAKAYKTSGSRPNQTPQSWAFGRLFSVLFDKKGARVQDADIVKKYRLPFLG